MRYFIATLAIPTAEFAIQILNDALYSYIYDVKFYGDDPTYLITSVEVIINVSQFLE